MARVTCTACEGTEVVTCHATKSSGLAVPARSGHSLNRPSQTETDRSRLRQIKIQAHAYRQTWTDTDRPKHIEIITKVSQVCNTFVTVLKQRAKNMIHAHNFDFGQQKYPESLIHLNESFQK